MPVKAFRVYKNGVLIRVSGGGPQNKAKRGIGINRGISVQITADVRGGDYEKITNDER